MEQFEKNASLSRNIIKLIISHIIISLIWLIIVSSEFATRYFLFNWNDLKITEDINWDINSFLAV